MIFASCQWEPYARSFIQQMYPNVEIDDSKIPKLIALIGRDVLRVQDPSMHHPCQIIAGNKYSQELDGEIAEAIDEFRREIHGK